MNKKSCNFIVVLDDYGEEAYNANISFPEEYEKSGTFEKLNMLYAIADMINCEINNLEIE